MIIKKAVYWLALNHQEKWEQKFALMQEYYKEFGCFPMDGVVYQGVKLGKWCANQKLLVKAGRCPADRLAKLQQCGLLGTTHDAKWEQNYILLQQFIEEFDRFPKRNDTYHDVQLGTWCAEQKRRSKATGYSPERIHKLGKIGLLQKHK